jgi:hypothetical protein
MPDLHLRLEESESDCPGPPPALDADVAITLLSHAEISGETLVPWGSNYTFAVALQPEGSEQVEQFGIYKPRRGERPLWDFPPRTLYLREWASWLLANALGWDIVPPTVVRKGPHGVGSLQLYLAPVMEEFDEGQTLEFWGQTTPVMEQIALFDLIANNADRKLTHLLRDQHDRIRGIDHGLTFNIAPKLRTVVWQFAGELIREELLEAIAELRDDEDALRTMFLSALAPEEIEAMIDRMDTLLVRGRHPYLDPNVNIPYGWW